MPLLEEEYRKEEKINGVIYDMSLTITKLSAWACRW